MNQAEICENCFYFSPYLSKGTCCRYAPKPNTYDNSNHLMIYAIWPTVSLDDSCGEWEEIPVP